MDSVIALGTAKQRASRIISCAAFALFACSGNGPGAQPQGDELGRDAGSKGGFQSLGGAPSAGGTQSGGSQAAGGSAGIGGSQPSGPAVMTPVYRINSGGDLVSPFMADQFVSGGDIYAGPNPVAIEGVANAAPAAVYQTERNGNFAYTFGSLTAGMSYTVRLHFAELYWTAAGQRVFNVSINGMQVLTNFDIFAQVGANKALVRDLGTTASAAGQIIVQYTGVLDKATSGGIELLTTSSTNTGSNHAPTVAAAAVSSPNPVTATTSVLSALGADDGGEANLSYTWAAAGSPPAPVSFSANAGNAAKSTTVTFSASGSYTFVVTITDAQGQSVQSTVTVAVTLPAGQSGPPGGTGWKLVWSDEFTGTAVDTTHWKYWLDGQTRRAAVNRASNTFVSDGALTVRTTNAGGQLTSGGLESKMGFGSGYFETRGKVLGGWAGFWLQSNANGNGGTPAVDGTEMDIMEACCPGGVQNAVHWGGYGATHQTANQAISGVTQTDWNVYGLEWTPTSYKFWVNGKLVWTFTTAISQRSDEIIRLTQETDGDFCGGQCDYLVDYVRVYTVAP